MKSLIRVRMSAHDAHYGGGLVDGAKMLQLFGDVATELLIINDGDEVVCPAPYWVSYKDIVSLAGGNMKLIHTTFESGFKLSVADIEKNVSNKTKVFILNSDQI